MEEDVLSKEKNNKLKIKKRKVKLRIKDDLYYIAHKKNIGYLLLIIGLILFVLGSIANSLIFSIEGILIGCMGAGLLTLGINEKKDDSPENINIYIGKQLFDKGLDGFVIGVVVGALKLFFK